MEIVAYNSRSHRQQQLSADGLAVGSDRRLVDLEINDQRLSGLQFVVHSNSENDGDSVTIENHGRSLVLDSGRRIHGGGNCSLNAPSFFWIGETCFAIEPSKAKKMWRH